MSAGARALTAPPRFGAALELRDAEVEQLGATIAPAVPSSGQAAYDLDERARERALAAYPGPAPVGGRVAAGNAAQLKILQGWQVEAHGGQIASEHDLERVAARSTDRSVRPRLSCSSPVATLSVTTAGGAASHRASSVTVLVKLSEHVADGASP